MYQDMVTSFGNAPFYFLDGSWENKVPIPVKQVTPKTVMKCAYIEYIKPGHFMRRCSGRTVKRARSSVCSRSRDIFRSLIARAPGNAGFKPDFGRAYCDPLLHLKYWHEVTLGI
jgi:hypothetical protein